jgi:hypothetical protein
VNVRERLLGNPNLERHYRDELIELGLQAVVMIDEERAWGADGMIFWAFDPGPSIDEQTS